MTSAEQQFSPPVLATPEDLDTILTWLRREYDPDRGKGFWGNRRAISEALDYEMLWVIRADGTAVAFQVGNYRADILAVRPDMRGQGLGKLIFEASLVRAFRDDVNVLQVQCEPKSSLGFWKKMGFEELRANGGEINARRALPRPYDLPPDLPKCAVSVEFHRDSALYEGGATDASRIAAQKAVGAQSSGGTIYLDHRVFEEVPYDAAVRVLIDGNELCFAKAKYDEPTELGFKYDRYGGTYYIDEIRPPNSEPGVG